MWTGLTDEITQLLYSNTKKAVSHFCQLFFIPASEWTEIGLPVSNYHFVYTTITEISVLLHLIINHRVI